jgi:UDP-N-acetyl-2-amino-2-deoxyglucuronate dehydrogenase
MSICSPNYLHDSHIRFSLRSGSDVICEKPLVLNSRNLDSLKIVENESGKKVNTILQLRLHPAIKDLKKKVTSSKGKKFDVDLTYIAPRGLWYKYSWKGNIEKSGGVETNIGVHLFDMLHFVFGDVQINEIYLREQNKSSGYLEFQNARVRWYLSLDSNDLLQNDIRGAKTFRSITCNDEDIEFSDGFTDLHTECYKEILNGNGFGLEENRTAIETVSELRTAHLKTKSTTIHPFLKK